MTQGQALKETISKLPKRECKYCGKLYPPTSARQQYCSLKCGEDYRNKKTTGKFPQWICDKGHITQLTFDPLQSPLEFKRFRCPICSCKSHFKQKP